MSEKVQKCADVIYGWSLIKNDVVCAQVGGISNYGDLAFDAVEVLGLFFYFLFKWLWSYCVR